jgi:two-component system sensor histidine kinase PrrB
VSGPRSLRARITLAALAALLVGGLLAGVALLQAVERDGRIAVDRDLRDRAARLVRGPGPGPGPLDRPARGRPPGDELLAGSGTFVQVAANGRVIEQRGDVPADPPAIPREDGFTTVEIDGQPWRSMTFSPGRGGDVRAQVLTTLEPVEARVGRIRRLILLLGVLALALTAVAAWAFTTVALRPLARLRAGAEQISGAEDLRTRLPDDGPDEVRALAQTLNEMLGRLERALQATRRFAGDAGHELRTPLTSLRANLDTLAANPDLPAEERTAVLREAVAEQERATHLIAGLQALARGEAAETLPREDVELADLVDSAIFAARKRHPSVTFAFHDDSGDAEVRGWPNGLRLVADNLLDNAALHGGGRVEATLGGEDGQLRLRVEDDGRGIPEPDRQRVLEPFVRGEGTTAPGTGLGLAIVAQQVTLHGGTLHLKASALGGLAAEARLPTTG